jgi:hypothetical protein
MSKPILAGAAVRRALALAAAFVVAGCATTTLGGNSPARPADSPSGVANGTVAGVNAPAAAGWQVTTLEHVDLWLHGFALLTSDTGKVPFFARGYKQQITALKRQKNIFTQLDANQQQLSARFATTPTLANAQFVAM